LSSSGSGTRTAPGGRRPRETAQERRTRYDGDDVVSLRERIGRRPWRKRLASNKTFDTAYRAGVGVVGTLLLVFGLVTIPLPGPGWLTVIAALFVLATEFTWAERLLEFTKRNVKRWTDWLGRQPVWVRVLFALLTAAFVYGVIVVVLHFLGVPSWVPGWVPMWR